MARKLKPNARSNHIARRGPRRPRKAPKSDGCVDGRMYRTVSDVVEDLKMTLKILNNTASFRTQENAPAQKSFLRFRSIAPPSNSAEAHRDSSHRKWQGPGPRLRSRHTS